MYKKNSLWALTALALVLAMVKGNGFALAADAVVPTPQVEESTESPIADMALIETDVKNTTEQPPVMAVSAKSSPSAVETSNGHENKAEKNSAQPHTVADFIIHPLIAFKPRQAEEPTDALGKQASTSSSTPAPSGWQLFGFNAGQGLGSSVSSLAGSVTGWFNDRIQLPGLVDTPVRESSTSTSSTTTTTLRPDVVVRLQHRGTTRRPLIQINNRNRPNRPNRPNKNTNNNNNNRLDFVDQDDEYDDDFERDPFDDEFDDEQFDDDTPDDDNSAAEDDDEEEEQSNENDEDVEEDDEEEEPIVQRPNQRRRPVQRQGPQRQQQNQRRRVQPQQQQGQRNQQRRRQEQNKPRQQQVSQQVRRRPVQQPAIVDVEDNTAEASDGDFYNDQQSPLSTKRSQNPQPNFIQRGQQSLIDQIRQFTRGQSPAEIGTKVRQTQQSATPNLRRRPQQATLLLNRNGQTFYVAPELLNYASVPATVVSPAYQYYPQQVVQKKRVPASGFPQAPLTVPLVQKGRPTQYITIPWSQLGILPPNQQIVSVAEGVQSQPLILNIPQSAITAMQQPQRKKKRPLITAEAVPLLADASLMDVFQPPKIPPSRTSTVTAKPAQAATPIVIASKPKPASLLPTRIRPGTIVEKAPMEESVEKNSAESDEQQTTTANAAINQENSEYIIIGDDSEPGHMRQVKPVYGDARFMARFNDYNPYYSVRRQGSLKHGRALEEPEKVQVIDASESNLNAEHTIPVQVIEDAANVAKNIELESVAPTPEPSTIDQVASASAPVTTSDSATALKSSEAETPAAPIEVPAVPATAA